jgi:hypothetical protein
MTDDPRAAVFEKLTEQELREIDDANWDDLAISSAAVERLIAAYRALLKAAPPPIVMAANWDELHRLGDDLARVTKERDDANREAEFQHARAAKWADMLKAAPPAEGPTDYDALLTSWAELRQEATRLRALLDGKGTWPNGTHRAFVEGAAWGFWKARGATFFGSERAEAETEAIERYGPVPTPPRDPAWKE